MYPPNGILYQPLTVLVYSTAVDGWNGVEESGAKQSISIVRSYFCFENHMYVCACVCSCVCREREGERAWERAGNYREAVRPHTTPLPAWGSSAIGLTLTYSLSTWGHFWPQMRQPELLQEQPRSIKGQELMLNSPASWLHWDNAEGSSPQCVSHAHGFSPQLSH